MKSIMRLSLLIIIIIFHVWLVIKLASFSQAGGATDAATQKQQDTSVSLAANLKVTEEVNVPVQPEENEIQKKAELISENLTQVMPDEKAREDAPEPLIQEVTAEAETQEKEIKPEEVIIEEAIVQQKNEQEPPRPEQTEPVSSPTSTKQSYAAHFDEMVKVYETRQAKYMPQLLLSYTSPNMHRQALGFFGFHLIGRPKISQSYYFERTPAGQVTKQYGKCPYIGWCLEALAGDESYFSVLARHEGIPLKDLELFYKSSNQRGEGYLRGVEIEAISKAQLNLAEVQYVEGILHQQDHQQYGLRIEKIVTR